MDGSRWNSSNIFQRNVRDVLSTTKNQRPSTLSSVPSRRIVRFLTKGASRQRDARVRGKHLLVELRAPSILVSGRDQSGPATREISAGCKLRERRERKRERSANIIFPRDGSFNTVGFHAAARMPEFRVENRLSRRAFPGAPAPKKKTVT